MAGSAARESAMTKADLKTKPTEVTAEQFIAAVPDERRRGEARVIDEIHRRVTGHDPKMWGPSIVGYGSYDYRYESGREGTMCRGGAAKLGCDEQHLSRLGEVRAGALV